MLKYAVLLVVLIVIGVPVGYGVHLLRNYQVIQKAARDHAAVNVAPEVDKDSVSEFGYIYDMRRETYYREAFEDVNWFIAVPSTGHRFGCGYLFGSADFRSGDSVTFIHSTKTDESEVGYVIGLHDRRTGKKAKVDCNDLEIANLVPDE